LPPLYEGIIEYQHADKIPAFLLRFSHSGRKFIRAAAQGGVSPGVTTAGGLAARKRLRPTTAAVMFFIMLAGLIVIAGGAL
jgi:hypothetical protein